MSILQRVQTSGHNLSAHAHIQNAALFPVYMEMDTAPFSNFDPMEPISLLLRFQLPQVSFLCRQKAKMQRKVCIFTRKHCEKGV